MRLPWLLLTLAAMGAAAQNARLAVHPLELREMTPAQQERLQAQFDVMLARIAGIRLAGSAAIEEALQKPAGKGCETRDDCLRFLAESTESIYAVYVRVRPDPLGLQRVVNARVVRFDGAVVRNVTLAAPLDDGAESNDSGRELLSRLLEQLELDRLSPTVTVEAVALPAAPVLFEQPVAQTPVRRPVGFALLGIGVGTLAAGGVLAGLAANGRSKLTPDARGAVPRDQAQRAMDVAREAQVATVLLPVGAVLSLVGGALAWWPTQQPIALSLAAGRGGAGLQLAGALP